MGAEGNVRIYDRKMVDEIMNLIGYNGNFIDLGNYNIYRRSIFGHDIYTVYYGDNSGYSRTIFTSSNNSSAGVTVNCSPPSADTMIHPIAWKRAKWILTFVFSNATNAAINDPFGTKAASNFCLRQYPLEQILQNEELKINGNSYAVSKASSYCNAFYRFANSVDDKVNEYSLTPNQLDEFYNYSDASLTAKNPFAQYGNQQIGESRFAFNCDYSTLVSNAGGDVKILAANHGGGTDVKTTLTFTFEVMEPIKISPMYYSQYALHGVKDMIYSASFANHSRMFCMKNGAFPANVTLNSVSAKLDEFDLHFAYSTPKLLSDIPNSIVYPYQFVDYYSKEASSEITSDATVQKLSFNAVNLSSVPRKLIIWVSEKESDIIEANLSNYEKTDTSKSIITNINITYANKQGIMSGASERDIFEISKKNGLLGLSYSQTARWVGSYVCLNFGEEIPLPEAQAPGTLANPQLSFDVLFKRVPGSGNRTYQLNTAIIYEGACTIIKNSSAIKQLSVLSADDVIESMQKDYDVVHPSKYANNNYGGRISGGSLLSVLSSALPIARMIRQGI